MLPFHSSLPPRPNLPSPAESSAITDQPLPISPPRSAKRPRHPDILTSPRGKRPRNEVLARSASHSGSKVTANIRGNRKIASVPKRVGEAVHGSTLSAKERQASAQVTAIVAHAQLAAPHPTKPIGQALRQPQNASLFGPTAAGTSNTSDPEGSWPTVLHASFARSQLVAMMARHQAASSGTRAISLLAAASAAKADSTPALADWLQSPDTLAPADVHHRIVLGKKFLRELHLLPSRPESPTENDNEPSAQDLVNAVWALAARSAADGQPFINGAFMLYGSIGGDGSVGTGAVLALKEHIRQTPRLYRRVSSHLKAFAAAEIYGLDIVAGQDGANLPGGRRHLLFHLIDDDILGPFVFIKAERYGTQDPADFLRHSVSYLQSMQRLLTGGNDGPESRKERVPRKLLDAVKAIVGEHPSREVVLKEISQRGVAAAMLRLQGWLAPRDPDVAESLEGVDLHMAAELLEELKAEYTNTERRIGRERIEVLPLPNTVRISDDENGIGLLPRADQIFAKSDASADVLG